MMVEAKLASLKGIKPHEAALRFLFGGLCTMFAGLIARRYGPAAGGLFLAFPAIFPAGASLIETHEIAHKRRIGHDGHSRGRALAGVDAAGTSLACVGLMVFAAIVWLALPAHSSWAVITTATVAWFLLSVALWFVRKSRLFHRRARPGSKAG